MTASLERLAAGVEPIGVRTGVLETAVGTDVLSDSPNPFYMGGVQSDLQGRRFSSLGLSLVSPVDKASRMPGYSCLHPRVVSPANW